MTLLVGILCPEGVVIATDRQVTHGALGTMTVGQAGTKATIIRKNEAIYASAGAVGLGQLIGGEIDRLTMILMNYACNEVMPSIQLRMRNHINPAFETAQKAAPVIGAQAVQSDCLCSGLLAARFKDGVHLIDLSPQGGTEKLTLASVPFVCQGSGKANADPFLRFLWNVYWSSKPPTLTEAVLAGYWTVKVVTDLHTMGVGCGIDVYTLKASGSGVEIKQFNEVELQEHNEFIAAAEAAMRSVQERMAGGSGPEVTPPPVPTPPAQG